MLSDAQIIDKYTDGSFGGSFSGARTFQIFLKTDLGEDISLNRIKGILNQLPFYIISQRPIRKYPRRHYSVGSYGELLQADLAFMFEKNDYKYFLLVIDVYSRKLFAEPLKDKSAATVEKAFTKIFANFPTGIQKLESDQGPTYP